MKKILMIASLALLTIGSFTSCREKTEEKTLIEEMQDKGADVEVSRDGDKIKMETDEEKVKIKTDDNGNTKIKRKDKNTDDN